MHLDFPSLLPHPSPSTHSEILFSHLPSARLVGEESKRERESLCVCMYVCAYMRESKT